MSCPFLLATDGLANMNIGMNHNFYAQREILYIIDSNSIAALLFGFV